MGLLPLKIAAFPWWGRLSEPPGFNATFASASENNPPTQAGFEEPAPSTNFRPPWWNEAG